MVAVFWMIQDGESIIAVEGEGGFEMLPLAVVNLDGELLGAAIMAAVWIALLDFELADFVTKGTAFCSPGDEDGMSVGVDEAKAFGSGFISIGLEV